jgi:lipopolysaccharide export system permease protein
VKIIHRYIFGLLVKNFTIGLSMFVFLFLMVDFFDRLDNVLSERAPIGLIVLYFLCKIPLMVNLMIPIAVIFATLFTYGLLSKSSELTAMRASGVTITWLGRPLILFSLGLSCASILLSEVIVPFSERRQKEIYNIDIRKKDKRGGYNQEYFWWRNKDSFYSVDLFDSRTNTLFDLSEFKVSDSWDVTTRTDADEARWVPGGLGWSMKGVTRFLFDREPVVIQKFPELPLPTYETPADFYEFNDDPSLMSFRELKRFIKKQGRNGVSTTQYLPDMYSKLAFPFVVLITALVVLPFTLQPARSGSMATSSLLAIFVAFTYYAVDSFSISMGRAELLPPLLAAWMANIVMGILALVLNLGAEAPH